ncbi:AGE family epimerase/isomerase [Pseudarthrobacter sp. SSS035]|uniref:AGE family epimerase/isomerase n=1 Tax=Pseudarthrobacter sp. SSS035 TaxID=2931399 RepID=UPI0020102F05|nr:AGE family epimerase/isomerase [Pseudarthrobacter sp. SSS035]
MTPMGVPSTRAKHGMTGSGISPRDHLQQTILPWWDKNGADDLNGGVLTCFSNAGVLQSTDKYTWSQGRWAWLCAELAADARLGILDVDSEKWSRRAIQTAEFVQTHSVLEGGLTAFRTGQAGGALPSGPNGELATSVFADLFAVLGLAGTAKLPGCPELLRSRISATAHEVLASSLARMKSRNALTAPYPVRPGFSDLAGPMTLLHAGSELFRSTGSEGARDAVSFALAELIEGQGRAPMLQETQWWEFRPDSVQDAESLLARHRTPGHLLECLWMLIHGQEAVGGSAALPQWLPGLALHALELGWDEEYGGLLRYVDKDGGVPSGALFGGDPYEDLVQSTWSTKLWWVHAEAMYATKLLARRYGGYGFEEWNTKITDYTLATFPNLDGHEWTQIRDRRGAPLDMVVALPVKDPFHIARTLMFLNRLEKDN